MRKNQAVRAAGGFTLIELLVVLVILGILAAIAAPIYFKRPNEAKTTAAKADLGTLKTSLATFQIDTGRLPSTEEGLDALIHAPADVASQWKGPYLEGIPTDKWGRAYIYRCPGTRETVPYDLYSLGTDGQEGTEDDVWPGATS
jgi:general secretion pathway protein G